MDLNGVRLLLIVLAVLLDRVTEHDQRTEQAGDAGNQDHCQSDERNVVFRQLRCLLVVGRSNTDQEYHDSA